MGAIDSPNVPPRPSATPKPAAAAPAQPGIVVPDRVWDWAAIGVVILGAMMRLWNLGAQSLWYDELFTLSVAMKSFPQAIIATAQDTGPPGFYIVEEAMVRLFGKSEVVMRALPAIAGVVTIGVIYLIGKRMFDAKTGFWAALLFAVSEQALYYAQEARAYSFLMLFAALGLLALLRLAEKPGWLSATMFGLTLLLMVYNHTYGVFGGFALVLAMVAIPDLRRRTGWWGIGAAAIAALLFVPWGIVTIEQVKLVHTWVAKGTWHLKLSSDLIGNFWSVIANFTPWPYPWLWTSVVFGLSLLLGFHGAAMKTNADPAPAASAENPYVVNPAAAAWVVDPLQLKAPAPVVEKPYRISPADAMWLLAATMVLPIVIGLLLSMWVLPIQELRCFLVSLPAAYLIVSFGAMTHWRPLSLGLLAVLLISAFIGVPMYYTSHSKGYYREAVQYMLSHDAQSGRVILPSNTRPDGASLASYLPFNINMYAIIEGYPQQFWLGTADWWESGAKLDSEIAPLLKNQNSVFVVTADVPFTNDQGRTAFDDTMDRMKGWKLVDTQNFEDRPKVEHWVLQGSPQDPQQGQVQPQGQPSQDQSQTGK